MGTRATIQFKDRGETYFVYRGHDGYPENVEADIKEVLQKIKGRWSEPELGTLVTCFLTMLFNPEKERLPDYELTPCFHGDESYRYFVEWDDKEKKWQVHYE